MTVWGQNTSCAWEGAVVTERGQEAHTKKEPRLTRRKRERECGGCDERKGSKGGEKQSGRGRDATVRDIVK